MIRSERPHNSVWWDEYRAAMSDRKAEEERFDLAMQRFLDAHNTPSPRPRLRSRPNDPAFPITVGVVLFLTFALQIASVLRLT